MKRFYIHYTGIVPLFLQRNVYIFYNLFTSSKKALKNFKKELFYVTH